MQCPVCKKDVSKKYEELCDDCINLFDGAIIKYDHYQGAGWVSLYLQCTDGELRQMSLNLADTCPRFIIREPILKGYDSVANDLTHQIKETGLT